MGGLHLPSVLMDTFQPPPPPPPPSFSPVPTPNVRLRTPSQGIQKKMVAVKWRRARGDHNTVGLKLQESGLCIELEQVPGKEEKLNQGTGFTVWDAALVLANYLELSVRGQRENISLPASNHDDLLTNELWNWNDKSVLEIGTGSGCIGIVCSALFPNMKHLTFTDQTHVLQLTERNIQLNSRHIPFLHDSSNYHLQELIWGDPEVKNNFSPAYDWIVVSDCVYPNVPANLLAQSIEDLCTPGHTVVLLAYEHRCEATRKLFFGCMTGSGFRTIPIPESHLHSDYRAEDIELYLFT